MAHNFLASLVETFRFSLAAAVHGFALELLGQDNGWDLARMILSGVDTAGALQPRRQHGVCFPLRRWLVYHGNDGPFNYRDLEWP